MWLLSTRSAPPCADLDQACAHFRAWRLGPDGQWVAAGLDALLAADDPAVPTTIYIHGNRADAQRAIQQAWPVYRCLEQDPAGRRFRFIIWSWPADRVRGRQLTDLRLKAARSDEQSLYLAWCLDHMRADVPVNLVGYSFGARVITGALHLLGGGQVAGQSLARRSSETRRPLRAVLVAAAIGNDWLGPGQRHGLALGQVDRLLVTANACDRALKWYPWLHRRDAPALGRTGTAWPCLRGADAAKVEHVSLSWRVGKVHEWTAYLNAPELRAQLPAYAFGEPSGEGPE